MAGIAWSDIAGDVRLVANLTGNTQHLKSPAYDSQR